MVHPSEMKWYTSAARYLYSVFSRVKQIEEAPNIPAPVDISGAVTCRLLGHHTWSSPLLSATCIHCHRTYFTHIGLGPFLSGGKHE